MPSSRRKKRTMMMRTFRRRCALATTLPAVIDCRRRADELPALIVEYCDPRNRLTWRFTIRAMFEGGSLSEQPQIRQIWADDYPAAELDLRRLMAGFACVAVEIYEVRPPVTPKELVWLDHVNRQLNQWRESRRPVEELVFC